MRSKAKSKIIIRAMLAVILICTTSIFLFKNIIVQINSNREKTIESFKEEQFKTIWNTLNSLQTQSKREITKISKNIEKDILELPKQDFTKIQENMDNDRYSETLHNIFMNHIKNESLNEINNHRNGIVIMTNDGFMEDFNYRRAENKTTEKSIRLWDESIESSYNKILDKNAVDKLLNRTTEVIAFESYDITKDENHIKIKELNYESLYNIFSTEGLNGLRNYQIFVPYYITDLGDIFGVPDIKQGTKVDNNKIIIAQEFNLYDQITEGNNDNQLYDENEIKNIVSRYDNVLRQLQLLAVIIMILVFILIFCICPVYNIAIDQEENEKEDINPISNEYSHTNSSDLTNK